jgi:hypothetical protein
MFVVGSQFSEQSVTPGISLPLPSFSFTTQRPPGAVHCASAEQNSPHVGVVGVVPRQMLPGWHESAEQLPPGATLPAASQTGVPVLSMMHASPAAHPHCGATSLQGEPGQAPPLPDVELVVVVVLLLVVIEPPAPPVPGPVDALVLLLSLPVEAALEEDQPPPCPSPPEPSYELPCAHAEASDPIAERSASPTSQRDFIVHLAPSKADES